MKKLAILLFVALSATGCGRCSRVEANLTGYAKVCVEGVTYIQFPSGSTVQVDLEGKPVACAQ
jgi:hypothetical protein